MSTKSLQNKSGRFCSSRWLLKDFPFFIAILFLATLNVFYLFLFASFYIKRFHFSLFILSQLIYIAQFALHLNAHYSDPGKRFPATRGGEEEEQAIEGKWQKATPKTHQFNTYHFSTFRVFTIC